MTSATGELPDEFEEGAEELPRMTLLDHLDELRKRLFASVVAVFVAFLACWYFSPTIFHWLQKPILDVLPARVPLSGPTPTRSPPPTSAAVGRRLLGRESNDRGGSRSCRQRA